MRDRHNEIDNEVEIEGKETHKGPLHNTFVRLQIEEQDPSMIDSDNNVSRNIRNDLLFCRILEWMGENVRKNQRTATERK